METVMKADIFFAVSTIAVAVVAIALVVALIYVTFFLRDVMYISKRVKKESDALMDDLTTLRASIKEEGFKVRGVVGFLTTLFTRSRKRKSVKEAKTD